MKWRGFWMFTHALSPSGLRWDVPARGPTGCTAFPKSSNGGKRIAEWSKPEHNAVLPHNWSRPENVIAKSDWPANGGMPHSWRSKTAVLGFGDGGGRNCGAARIGKPHRHEEKTHTGFAKRGKTSEWVLPDRFPKRLPRELSEMVTHLLPSRPIPFRAVALLRLPKIV
jgi:hypothetical protein